MSGIWEILFELAPVKRSKPPSTLYDVIVDTRDLAMVQRYVEGGHAPVEQFAGGHSVNLAVAKGDLEFVKYFVAAAADIQSIDELLTNAVRRLAESSDEQADEAGRIFNYVLDQPLSESQLTSGYLFSATAGQFSAAKKILAAGLQDHDIRVGQDRYQLLSARLGEMGNPDFAALLKGEPVDESRLERKEGKERRLNARLRGTLDDLELFADQRVLTGTKFDARYQDLQNEIQAGKWDQELTSTDPRFGQGVLEFAAANGFVELVGLVLARPTMSPKSAQSAGRPAAIAAATYGYLDILKALQANGISVEETPKGANSPLSEACRYGHYEVVRYLLQEGADSNSGDGSGHNLTLAGIAGGERRNEVVAALNAVRA